MATKEELKWKFNLTTTINGPTADQLWPLLADFGNLYLIFPSDVSFSAKGIPGQSGEVRYSAVKTPSPSDANKTIILWAEEELLEIDQTQRFVTYEILANNRGLKKFIGNMQVLPIDHSNSCKFKWSVVCDPVDGYTYESFGDLVNSTLEAMVEKIDNLFASS